MNIAKNAWKKPQFITIKKEKVKESIKVSACSKYVSSPCNPFLLYIDSIPGGGKPEFE